MGSIGNPFFIKIFLNRVWKLIDPGEKVKTKSALIQIIRIVSNLLLAF